MKENQDVAFGLDFPFGLPYALVEQESWEEFIIAFPNLYDSFVKRLATVCKPHNKVFEEFEKGSTRAYSVLENFWAILHDTSISKKDREKKSELEFRYKG